MGANQRFSTSVILAAVAMAAVCDTAKAATAVWNFANPYFTATHTLDATASMSYFDASGPTDAIEAATTFGRTICDYSKPSDIDGRHVRYLHHGPLPCNGRSGYAVDHAGFEASTADGLMDQWTMVFDVWVPDACYLQYNGMFNTDPALDGGAAWYLGPAGSLGHCALGTTDDHQFVYDQWQRIGLVFDRLNHRVKYWVNGVQVFQGTTPGGEARDDYLLFASDHSGTDLVFQGDGSGAGRTSEIYLGSFALSDFAYDDATMRSLGGPSAGGIPAVPKPERPGALAAFNSPDQLDLEGHFRYAINVGGSTETTIRGLRFHDGRESIAGYRNTMSPGFWSGTRPEFGEGQDVDALENILETVAYHASDEQGDAAEIRLDVVPGESYKLQLLFWRAVGARTFDVSIDGKLALDEFNPEVWIDESLEEVAYVYTHEFTAQDEVLTILFEPGTADVGNHQPMLNALTLEWMRTTWIPGDADGDGSVDQTDAAILADHWGALDAGWTDGDFNDDGVVNAADAAILAANWGSPAGGEARAVVPEPLGLVLIGSLGLLLAIRRRG